MSRALPNQVGARKRANKYYARQCWGCGACGATWDDALDACPACKSAEAETLLRFDSKAERTRWGQLRLMVRAGMIQNLHRQVRYELVVNGFPIGTYIADHCYVESGSGKAIVEDVKGMATPVYNLKKRLMKALFNVDIVEVKAR